MLRRAWHWLKWRPRSVGIWPTPREDEPRGEAVDSDDESLTRSGLASYQLGHTLFVEGRYEDSLEHSAQAAKILGQLASLQALGVHARALQGGALYMLGRYDDSIGVCDQVLAVRPVADELLDQLDPELGEVRLRDFIADAWWYKTSALEELGRLDEADIATADLIGEFDPGATPQQQWIVAQTFLRRGRLAHARGDAEEALAALEAARVRCVGSDGTRWMRVDCLALFERASVLEEAARNDEALAAYEELVSRFRSVDDSDVQEAVADALRLKSRLSDRGTNDTGT
jgi:tetratricopeptide (TPR) repeat protein